MNADVINQLTTDMRNLSAWLGNITVVWNNQTYTAFRTRLSSTADLQEGGTISGYAGRVTLLLREFQTESPPGTWTTGPIPSIGEFVTINGQSYRIDRVVMDDSHPSITLHLMQGENPLAG